VPTWYGVKAYVLDRMYSIYSRDRVRFGSPKTVSEYHLMFQVQNCVECSYVQLATHLYV